MNKFLKKTENDIKIEFGQPDSIENLNNNKVLVYRGTKFKIKCERRFEVNAGGTIIAFSSSGCF